MILKFLLICAVLAVLVGISYLVVLVKEDNEEYKDEKGDIEHGNKEHKE